MIKKDQKITLSQLERDLCKKLFNIGYGKQVDYRILAKMIGSSKRHVIRLVKSLEEKMSLNVKRPSGKQKWNRNSNKYKLLFDPRNLKKEGKKYTISLGDIFQKKKCVHPPKNNRKMSPLIIYNNEKVFKYVLSEHISPAIQPDKSTNRFSTSSNRDGNMILKKRKKKTTLPKQTTLLSSPSKQSPTKKITSLKITSRNSPSLVTDSQEIKHYKLQTPSPIPKNYIKNHSPVGKEDLDKIYYKQPAPIKVTRKAQEIIEYWVEEGLRMPVSNAGSCYKHIAINVNLALKKYDIEQIKIAISNFALMALDPAFEPSDIAVKKTLKRLYLYQFVSNPFGKVKSYLEWCVEREPIPAKKNVEVIPDKYPSITNYMKNFYLKKVLCGLRDIDFTKKEENAFRNASKRLADFYHKTIDLMGMNPPSLMELAKKLCYAVFETANGRTITPWWFGSDVSFTKTLPDLLVKEAIMEQQEEYEEEEAEIDEEVECQSKEDYYGEEEEDQPSKEIDEEEEAAKAFHSHRILSREDQPSKEIYEKEAKSYHSPRLINRKDRNS